MISSPCPVAIPPELTELIATKLLSLQTLRKASAMLPESDAELHEWLVTKAAEADDVQFNGLCAAAAVGNRRLQASLLPPMLGLRPDIWLVAWLAWRMEGDVAEQLLLGMGGARISGQLWAISLFMAAAWWLEHRRGDPLPPQITRSAIDLLQFELDERTLCFLQSLVTHVGTEAGREIFSASKRYRDLNVTNPGAVKAIFRSINRPFEEMLSERPTRCFSGGTQRRAVDKTGRNAPCPCGSGKKYKTCCEKSELKRVLDSSSIPGVTRSELEADPHIGLDKKRLEKFLRPALLALEPMRIPDKLQIAYLFRLSDQKCCDRIVEAFEIWGTPVKRPNVWAYMFQPLKWEWRPDLARRLAKLSPENTHTLAEADVRLLLVGDDPAAFLQELEIAAKEVLESGDLETLELLAGTVESSPYRALGVLLMRGHLPLSGDESCQQTYDAILRARAKLGLGPNDAFSEWMNEKTLRKSREHETDAVQKAQDKLVQTAEQARRAAEDNQRLERDLRLLRKRERTQQEANAPSAIDEETQSKIRALMADKKNAQTLARERGDAELEARKALEKLTRENEELKTAASSSEGCIEEAEEEGREEFSLTERQPARPIAFPKDFVSTLEKFKPHVARAAMLRLGRMGAGEPDAFDFIKKIKALEDALVLEARVSERYRLLFCLLPKYIRVVGLVYRPELDKFVDHCKIAGLPPVTEFE